MRRAIEILSFVVFLFVGSIVAGLSWPACSSAPGPHAPATRAQLASVVLLVEQVAEWREPSLTSEDFGEHTGDYASAWQARCNAFALDRDTGAVYLVTAAHCLRERALGSIVRYLPPDGWGVDSAVVVRVDRARDYAELAPARLGGLVALTRGPAPADGEPVLSVCAFFQEQAPGRSKGEYTGSWFGTTQHVDRGWSGSPVFARSSGGAGQSSAVWRVWGFLAKCETYEGKCANGAVVGALPSAGAL